MSVRKKLALAYIAAAIAFLVAMKLLLAIGAHAAFFPLAALAVAAGLAAYVTVIKCPNCGAKAFSRRWLVMPHIPRTCATCDRDFSDQ